jgi:hypothetical protein
MFVTFLMPYIDRGQGPIFHWVMTAQMAKFGPAELTVIADDRYFALPLDWGKERFAFGVHYRHPTSTEWNATRKIALSRQIFDELERDSRSMLDAYRTLLSRDYPPLRKALCEIFSSLVSRERPEAVLSWCNVPSLELAAAEYGIPVIHNELGPFREPHYQGTIYFDFDGVNGRTSAARDMAAFRDEVRIQPEFSALDLTALAQIFLNDPARIRPHSAPEFKAGAALQVEDDSNMIAFNNGLTNFELIFAARKGIRPEDVLVRPHPHGYLAYGPKLGVPDNSSDSLHFISRCEKIFCTNSSVIFEALLAGKPVFVLGDSPAAALSSDRTSGMSREDLLIFLNYAFAGYLAPISVLFDAAYYRWRLTYPSHYDIYRTHLELFRKTRSGA